jgi:hypothetical protein
MSDYTTTPNLGLYKPTPNADGDMWGDHLNANADILDAAVGGGSGGGPFVPLNGSAPMTGKLTAPGLVLTGLPTSASGLAAGTVWNNGGVLCIA